MAALLSIAGLDPSGGAGLLADLDTFRCFGFRGAAIATAVTAQNRSRVLAVHIVQPAWVRQQADALLAEGRPLAVKIGMLGSEAVVREVAKVLRRMPRVPVVLDPVLRASAGAVLLDAPGQRALVRKLLPLVTVVKPNLAEAERLLGRRIHTEAEMVEAARALLELGPRAVVITGGNRKDPPLDVLCDRQGVEIYRGTRIPVQAHGTGCRFTSALAALLARGLPLRSSIRQARRFVRKYLKECAASR